MAEEPTLIGILVGDFYSPFKIMSYLPKGNAPVFSHNTAILVHVSRRLSIKMPNGQYLWAKDLAS